jgi:D-3-phosphoglycerate dehydrogenase
LASARNIVPANLALKNGIWARSKFGGVELQDKTVGIIGMGKIGLLVAKRLAGFDMKFVAYDPYVKQAPSDGPEIKMVELDELLKVSDFITIHIPKTAETTGLIGKAAFSQVKPTVHIINAARGGVVDEDALFEALTQGQVAGAGLDVYATEPATDSPLFALDQVVATPHLGASTEEAQEKAGIAVAQSVVAFFSGNEVPGAVNTAQLK